MPKKKCCKKLPPLFIAGAAITTLILAYKFVFGKENSAEPQSINQTSSQDSQDDTDTSTDKEV